MSLSALVSVGDKRRANDVEWQASTTDFSKNLHADIRKRRGHVAHRHRRIEGWTEAARGDCANLFRGRRIGKQRRALAHRRRAFWLQADATTRCAPAKLRQYCSRPKETAGPRAAGATALLHRPFQGGFDRRCGGIDIMAVKAQPRFEPKAVARTKPNRPCLAALKKQPCQLFSLCGRN